MSQDAGRVPSHEVERVMHEQNVLRETAEDVVRRRLAFEARRNGLTAGPDVSQMHAPVRCKWCGCVHDSGPVTVVARYSDCSVWRCPGCGVLVDDRDPRWGGGVYKLDRQGRER